MHVIPTFTPDRYVNAPFSLKGNTLAMPALRGGTVGALPCRFAPLAKTGHWQGLAWASRIARLPAAGEAPGTHGAG